MSSHKPQPISGVSADAENLVMSVWPSISATGLGRGIGVLSDSIPIKINGIKLSHLLFPLPLSPFALLEYARLKFVGDRYVLTNRSVQIWKSLGSRLVSQVSLADIDQIDVEELPGQAFYRAADLVLLDAAGKLLIRLQAVPCAEVFRQTIIKARDAHLQVGASLAVIQARQSA
jgi:hypothetical protein